MLNSITTEINEFKGSVEKQNKIFAGELKEVAQESAERDNQLSKFVELETKKVLDVTGGKYDKLKYLLTRVAEQFKAHLKKFEKATSEMKSGITDNTIKINDLYEEVRKSGQLLEDRLQEKIQNETNKLLDESSTRFKIVENYAQKISEKQTSDFEVLKEAIEGQSDVFNGKIDKLAELSEQYHKNNFLNLKLLVGEIENHRKALTVLDKELEDKWNEVDDRVS